MNSQKADSANVCLNGKTDTLVKNENSCVVTVIGIGASAGGLEALELFFMNVDPLSGAAFVVIQHLDKSHKSLMSSLLVKYTKMEIIEITDALPVKANTIYLAPPNCIVDIIDNILYVKFTEKTSHIVLPIDYFFSSLAKNSGRYAFGVILSGSGSDGSKGVESINVSGGIVLAQSESQAKYLSMPKSAIDTGLVDFILPVELMPKQIESCLRSINSVLLKTNTPEDEKLLQEIIKLIHLQTGRDFSHYKKNTIYRRVERRMVAVQIDSLENYVAYLVKESNEISILFNEILINVTRFFRDPDAFEFLETIIIPEIVDNKKNDQTIRIWVCGCSTGEEAYSLAMLFTDVIEKKQKNIHLQLFASDIDADAIEVARKARYPANDCSDISPYKLNKYFTKEGKHYHLCKAVRDTVVFALQDIVKDPPFSQIDMISCRNVLIYMDQLLQKQMFSTFHYSLKNTGILFLGASESIGEYSGLFLPLDTKWKVYQRIGITTGSISHPFFVNRQQTAAPFIKTLSTELYRNNLLVSNEIIENMDLETLKSKYILLEQELNKCREYLQKTVDEQQAVNDEILTINEELQCTNEELETSKEELQSTNEELVTVNAELLQKVDQLTLVGNEVNNLLASTDIASLFLDTNLCIKRFTPSMKKIFHLIDADVGRSIRDINSIIVSFNILKASQEVVDTLKSKYVEVCDENNCWYALRILPYKSNTSNVEGVVVTLIDITELKQKSVELCEATLLAENIVDIINEALVVLDINYRVHSANRLFYKEFGFRPEEVINKYFFDLSDGQWGNNDLKNLLDTVIQTDTKIADYKINYLSDNSIRVTLILNAIRIPKTNYILLQLSSA